MTARPHRRRKTWKREIEKILMGVKELGITTIIVEQNVIAALTPPTAR